MKIFIAFLFVYLFFGDGKGLPTINIVQDPPVPAFNVTINATWAFTSSVNITNVVLDIYNLKASQYAAFGLSQNQSMGESHVFMCKRFANETISIIRYVNPGAHQHPQPAGSDQGGVLIPLPSKFVDGVVTCQFILSNFTPQTVEQLNTLRPLSQSGNYNPIFAVGALNSTGDTQYHDGREAKPILVQLNQNQNIIYHQNNTPPFNEVYPSS